MSAEERDQQAQETAQATPHNVGRTCTDWLPAVHPDTGEAVVFKPGELLPDWVVTP